MNNTNSEIDEYYNHSRPKILELIPVSAQHILDVGCGAGSLGASIKARQNAEVHGVEIVNHAASLASQHLDKVFNCSIEKALTDLPDNYYDSIILADVLEHLVDPWEVLTDIKHKLAPKGKIIASIPNIQNWDILSDLIQGRWDYHSEGILDKTHLRFFTRKSVHELFWNAGLRIVNLTTFVKGVSTPKLVLKALSKKDFNTRELEKNGQTYQFLIEAELPITTKDAKVIIVILNWNGKNDTLECLSSVLQIDYSNFQIVVVDNGSTDESISSIRQSFPSVTIIETGKNLGFAEGNNIGISFALQHEADYIFLLNNDTIVDTGLLKELLRVVEIIPEGGIFGAKIFYYSEPQNIWHAGVMWNHKYQRFKHIGEGQKDGFGYDNIREVDCVTGCALLASSETFKRVGMLDEKFFLTYEETDWCYRARKLGIKSIYVPKAQLWHKVSVSFGGNKSPLANYFMARNRLLWAKKHLGVWDRTRLKIKFCKELKKIFIPPFIVDNSNTSSSIKKFYWAILHFFSEFKKRYKDPKNKAQLLGIRDYIVRRFGDCPESVRKLYHQSE